MKRKANRRFKKIKSQGKNQLEQTANPQKTKTKQHRSGNANKKKKMIHVQLPMPDNRIDAKEQNQLSQMVSNSESTRTYKVASFPPKKLNTKQDFIPPAPGPRPLLEKDKQLVKVISDCFVKMSKLQESSKRLSVATLYGAMLCNMTTITLACQKIKNPQLLALFKNAKELRHHWAHYYFPEMPNIFKGLDVSGDVLSTLAGLADIDPQALDKQLAEKTKATIQQLYLERHREMEICDATVQAFSKNLCDPRPWFSKKLETYLSLINELNSEFEECDEGLRSTVCDALLFYVSRVGELIKHLTFSAKEHIAIRDDFLHIFDNRKTNLTRLQKKLIDTRKKLVTLKIPEKVLAGDWKPFVDTKFSYDDTLVCELARWRVNALQTENLTIKVNDMLLADELHTKKLIEQLKKGKSSSIVLLPIKLATGNLCGLAIKYNTQGKIAKLKYIGTHAASCSSQVKKLVNELEGSDLLKIQDFKVVKERVDQGPRLVESFYHVAESLSGKNMSKQLKTTSARQEHMRLVCENDQHDVYFKQFVGKGNKVHQGQLFAPANAKNPNAEAPQNELPDIAFFESDAPVNQWAVNNS